MPVGNTNTAVAIAQLEPSVGELSSNGMSGEDDGMAIVSPDWLGRKQCAARFFGEPIDEVLVVKRCVIEVQLPRTRCRESLRVDVEYHGQ